jgi:hypothetical protein
MDSEVGSYRILMDGQWRLEDLYQFPHAFAQLYSFLYSFGSERRARNDERIDEALFTYPWRGGYSVVNLYTVLKYQVWPQDRPLIREIRYASPGWIDLALVPVVAFQAAWIIAKIAERAASVAQSYSKLQTEISKIRRHQQESRIRELKLAKEEYDAVLALSRQLADDMGFEQLEGLNERTGDVVVSAQMVCSLYRRGKALSHYLRDGKATLPLDEMGTLPAVQRRPPIEPGDGKKGMRYGKRRRGHGRRHN